ncbi:MAG: hypothetical protein P9C48_14240 [Defluviicoccus sp.]|nr:hypothetical protein [Defluviicoccus sp.]MDG4610279.1 hypothetical protein [Defluviicoccus sp.]
MSEQHIHISVNLDCLCGQLKRSLQKIIFLVSASLQKLALINAETLELPIPFKTVFDDGLMWSRGVLQENYCEWVLCNGFRDAIEAVGAALEEAHRVLTLWSLLDENSQCKLSGAKWNELFIEGDKHFHRLGLPDKLSHLRLNHELFLDEHLSSHLLSINKARNCLVHRGGTVSGRDVTTNNEMEVTWRSMCFFLNDEGGEKALQIGARVEKGSIIGIRFQDTCKSFSIGQRIRFRAQEVSDVCWSLFLFGDDLVQKISDLGLQRGFLNAKAESA